MRRGCTLVALFLYLTAVTRHPIDPRSATAHSQFSSQHLGEEQTSLFVKANQTKHQAGLHHIAENIFRLTQGLWLSRSWIPLCQWQSEGT